MTKKTAIAAVFAVIASGVLLLRNRLQGQGAPGADNSDTAPQSEATDRETVFNGWWASHDAESQAQAEVLPPSPNPDTNVQAFLAMIKKAEGTANKGNPYAVCYAYRHTIQNFSDHPAITGEWRGEPLSAAMCKGAGLGPGCVSTAAGAYQIIKPTWVNLQKKLRLPDFSPASQDAAAIELLRHRGAIPAIEQGRFADAINLTKKDWASLTGAGYGQGERSLQWLEARFTENGGIVA